MFLETIKYEDGRWFNLGLHQHRMNHCRRICLQRSDAILLAEVLATLSLPPTGLFKVRIQYDEEIDKIEWMPYQLKYPGSLRLVYHDSVDYSFKYQNRTVLDNLFAKRGDCDDIIIVKQGLLTDTYYANIALFDGQRWVTPAHPLLSGTQRARLLAQNRIVPGDIKVRELPNYQKLIMLNAFMDFDTSVEVPVSSIEH